MFSLFSGDDESCVGGHPLWVSQHTGRHYTHQVTQPAQLTSSDLPPLSCLRRSRCAGRRITAAARLQNTSGQQGMGYMGLWRLVLSPLPNLHDRHGDRWMKAAAAAASAGTVTLLLALQTRHLACVARLLDW